METVEERPSSVAGSGTGGLDFLAGGGQVGERMRALDWSRTPLGPAQTWPWHLRLALSICLNSRFPIAVYWGPEFILLYTDLELAQELARRAAIAIDNALLYRETQRAVRVRDEFLLVASHELRSPMAPLTISLRTLQRAEQSGRYALPAMMSESVELAARQGVRLNRLIGDLLEISRMEIGRPALDLSKIELGAVVRKVAGRFEPELASARCPLSIRCDAPVIGRWDASRIDRVVTSLLSNAVKFGAGKPVEIDLGHEAGMAQLSVRDHGIGIDPAQHARIFERFERAVSVKHYGGLGLGLSVSRRIVEAHGGTIRVESSPEQGSTFIVELPCAGPKDGGPGGGVSPDVSPHRAETNGADSTLTRRA